MEDDEEYDPEYEDKMLNVPLEYIGLLSAEERKQLQKEFSHMPAYLFMSEREKKKYFDAKSREYKTTMDEIKEKKSEKKVKFSPKFEVRPFKDKEKVLLVSEASSFSEKYQTDIHFDSIWTWTDTLYRRAYFS